MAHSMPILAEDGAARAALARAEIAYTDLDGTLLGRGGCLLCDIDGSPSLAAAEAIVDLNARQMPVVVVSGRTMPMLVEITRMCGWRDFVAETGCIRYYDRGAEIVYDLGEWSPSDVPPGKTPHEVIEDAGAIRALFEAFPGRLEHHSPHHLNRQATHLLRGHVDDRAAQAVLDAFAIPIAIVDNGIIHPPATGLVDVDQVHAYHVQPRGTGKAQAILADLDRRGLDPEQAIMIGDSHADLAVHDAVGLLVLVANALGSPLVADSALNVDNLAVTAGASGEGWAEFSRAWIVARGR